MPHLVSCSLLGTLLFAIQMATAAPVISEIMYHPPGAPENEALEWIELHNPETVAADLTGARFSSGISYSFPTGTIIPPGGRLVVAASVAAFQQAHPAVTNVIGGWTGRLSNSGERIRIESSTGDVIHQVEYADEGDWAQRVRGPLHFFHRGWDWESRADGGGSSLEIRNPALAASGSGQNWADSLVDNGTPGQPNSVASLDVAPLITDVAHTPAIPKSTEPVKISARIWNETPGATALLWWRVDQGTWTSVPMSDSDGDGAVDATLPPQPNLRIIEFYVQASDGSNSRTWPARARTSDAGVIPAVYAQTANALLQVDDSFDPNTSFLSSGNQPLYRFVMTAAENQELIVIQTQNADSDSDAEMNATFISQDGTGLKVRYLVGVRNRGFGSRLPPPGFPTSHNYYVAFRSDELWEGRQAIQLNCQYPHSQVLGAMLMDRAGIAPQSAAIVRLRLNGADRAATGALQYGRYVRIEPMNGEWAERHFPEDPDGNIYRLDDHEPNPAGVIPGDLGSGEFRFEGTNPSAYADTFLKDTNKDADNWSDLIEFSRVVSAPATGGTVAQPAIANDAYVAAVGSRLNLDQFYTFIATDALIGNQEGGLQSGRCDDAGIYRGVLDPRFVLIPHDFDDVFNIGTGAGDPITRSIFSYDTAGGGVQGLTRLFNHPALVPRYYAKVLEQMDRWFNRATTDPLVDQVMAGWVPGTLISTVKNYVDLRRSNILSQIQQNYSITATTTGTDVDGIKTTPDGAATLSGTFNVAKTYSVTVNGAPAQWFYRTVGSNTAGTWRFVVTAGSGFLQPGMNRVTVRFHDGLNGAGNVIEALTTTIYFPGTATQVAGVLSPPGSLAMSTPATYIPGAPFVVRLDLRNSQGNLDRAAWDRVATLTASGGVTLTPNTVRLFNGVGSAVVTASTGGTGTSQPIFVYGASGAPGSIWRYLTDGSDPGAEWKNEAFDDSTWPSGPSQIGYGDGDENTPVTRVDFDPVTAGVQSAPSAYFRNTFTITDATQLASLTGNVKYDDAAAVYVNGTQVFRTTNLATDAGHTTYATSQSSDNSTAAFTVPLNLVKNGVNTIAVEIHQVNAGSGDLTFDLRLNANFPIANPGNFTVTASVSGITAARNIVSLFGQPQTTAAGTLSTDTTWSGIVNVTSDVIVPAGVTLTVAPGTHILMAGTSSAGDTGGADLIVQGRLLASGSALAPISITAPDAASRWGQIYLNGAQPSTLEHVLLNHAGHVPGQGHTGRGPMIRLSGASVTLDHSVLTNGPAKAMYSSGTCDVVIRNSLISQMITGPELGDGCSLLIEDSNIQEILPDYRESNAAAPDDEDCLYVHNNAGRSVVVRRAVFALCGDDVFDCLGGPITVEDSILRDGWDKGMSLLNNNLTITRTQIINCDKAIVPKSSTVATRVINVDRCTIVCENHDTTLAPWNYAIPPSDPDPDTPSTGLYTQNKVGQSVAGAILAITAKDSIIIADEPVLVDALYPAANTVVNFSVLKDTDTPGAPMWAHGANNIASDPLFVNGSGRDYRLTSGSPCRDAGDPTSSLDPDGSRADMGALPFVAESGQSGVVVWSPAGGPYYVTDHLVVPTGMTLRVLGGTSVYVAHNKRITVNGALSVEGTPDARVVFSHLPGAIAPGDADPIKNGVQTGPPKWGGLRIVDSMAQENVVRHADFINAQGTDPATSENWGSLGFIRSWGLVEDCTWSGTHLRMCYGRNAKLTVRDCTFPDMFLDDPILGRIENPTDFLPACDNRQEPLKVEYPTTDTEIQGNPNFTNGFPAGGWFRVYSNHFYGNRGHNDVFDADSGRWGQAGQLVLDCRYNHFHGITGDEHIDLGGDAYIASNVFERGAKDEWTSDTGYSNAISSGDRGTGTTVMVVRNFFFDLDHAINLKASTGSIFEHNTVARFNPDFVYNGVSFGTPFTQDVKCAVVNVFVPEDGSAPTRGDGAYFGYNLISNVPRLLSGADARKVNGNIVNDVTTKVQFTDNLLHQIADQSIGANHPGGIFNPAYGTNQQGDPGFVDASQNNFNLRISSAARQGAPGEIDYGATIPEWAYILGGPGDVTKSQTATFQIGGPGMVAFKWRLNGGAWSAPIQIGTGGVFPRDSQTVRQATLTLNNLSNGLQKLEVLGRDMAGNWQDADPARDPADQFGATVREWTVDPQYVPVRIHEVLADGGVTPDSVELHNTGEQPINVGGWFLTDALSSPTKLTIPAGVVIPAGGYQVVTGLALDRDGDGVYLLQGTSLVDSVQFGPQVTGLTIGRIGRSGNWTLCQPTLGAGNTRQLLGEPTSLRINEWFTSGNVLYNDDWIELANTGPLPVELAGLTLTDNPAGNPQGHTIAPLSFIGANGFVKFIADNKPSLGPTHMNIALDASQEQIALFDGPKEIDLVIFFPQTTDYSMGRDANSASGYTFYELPTGGSANVTTSAEYMNALAILRGLRITELMYNPVGGQDYEFLELRNVGATPLNLAGVRFVEGITFTFGELTLEPGANVVLVSNLQLFRQRYGPVPRVGGTFTGRLDNSGETLALRLPPPFDANVLTFSYDVGWQPSASGRGKSIVVVNPQGKAATWGDASTWTFSPSFGGDPDGVVITAPDFFTPWLAHFARPNAEDDLDADGISAFLEYAFAMDPTEPNEGEGAAGLPSAGTGADGKLELHFEAPENLSAVQNHGRPDVGYVIEASDNLATWTVIASKLPASPWTGAASVTIGPASNGLVPVVVRDPQATGPARYLRLRTTLLP
jgi:hypothetical protein